MLNQLFQNTKHNIDILRSIKRQGILNSCRQHQAPISILDPSILSHDLTILKAELDKANQELAIPISDLSKFYQLPLCDCTFSNNKVIIHLRVPIAQKSQSWELFELITTPFAWQNQTCVIKHEAMLLAVSKHHQTFKYRMRQISGTGLRHCKPFHDKLCYVPRFSSDTLQGPTCAKKLFTGAPVEELNYLCPMSCHKSTSTIISEVAEETYVITHPKYPTSVVCHNQSNNIPDKSYNFPGATKINVPCDCKLIMGDEEMIPERFPCRQTLPQESQITHIIPAAWSNLKSFILNPKLEHPPLYLNFTESLNENWTLNVPHLNLTTTNDNFNEIVDNIRSHIKYIYANTYGQHSDTIFLIWNSLLSIGLAYLLFRGNHMALLPVPANPVRGDTNTLIQHDILFGCVCTGLIIFILFLVIKILITWWNLLKKQKTTVTEVPVPTPRVVSTTNNRYTLEIPNEAIDFLPGQSVRCTLQKTEE